ncbi:MAG: ATP-binding protein, partial [Bacteroidota bacterium]
MIEKKNILKRIFLVLGVVVFLVFVNLILKKQFLSSQNDSETKTKNIENILREKEKLSINNLEKLVSKSENNLAYLLFSDKNLSRLYDDEKISFFLYRSDSLVYWSSNSVSLDSIQKDKISDSCFVKLSNGWYELIKRKKGNLIVIAAILVKSEYKYENDYLHNDFNDDFCISAENAKVSKTWKQFIIKNYEGKALFSIAYKTNPFLSNFHEIIIFILYLFAFLALLYLVYLICFVCFINPSQVGIRKLAFLVLIVIARILLFYFKIPHDLYNFTVFSPIYFASSEWLPSLGDLLINTIILFTIAVFLYKNPFYEQVKILNNWISILLSFSLFIFSALLFFFVIDLLHSIVIDSTISYNLNQLFAINFLSILGFFIISLTIVSYFLISYSILDFLFYSTNKIMHLLTGVILACILLFILHPYNSFHDIQIILCFVVFNGIYLFFRFSKGNKFLFYEIVIYLLLFTYLTYYTINKCNTIKEIEKRKSFAQKLSSGEDPLAEYIFRNTQKDILADSILKQKLTKHLLTENDISDYVTKKYFFGYWDKYKIQITVCNNYDSLLIEQTQEKRNCIMYFDDLIRSLGKNTSCKNLFSINDGSGGNNYVSKLEFNVDSSSISVFIELNSKFIPKDLGYPELLIDKKLFINTDLSSYSYAKYVNNTLIDAYGKYYYSSSFFVQDSRSIEETYVFNKDGYNHMLYKIDNNSFLIISKKNGNVLDTLAPFSIIFTIFCITLIFVLIISSFSSNVKLIQFDFRNRLQVSMVSIILVSFIIIGISTYYFIRNLNDNKNTDILSEKAMSILLELQPGLSEFDTINNDQQMGLSNRLNKLSNVFFTDINVFDIKGDLIASSRSQIFTEGLISKKMNSLAYRQMITEKTTQFIQKEKIGKLEYFSAYVPFYNRKGKVLYYVNLPYFAKESELKKELSSFLIAFINIYVFLIAMTVLIALFVAGRITRPLNIIREKISNLKLGIKNEKINWPRRDEIGSLISEYNRMIDELSNSAGLLARSEREIAWREMAMQVAHEIKNPLTPMKLSVQYLDKAWKDKAPDWEIRLERFTKNIVEQIDSLSTIASEFSYFAKMPEPHNEIISLTDIVKSSVEIFKSNSNINVYLVYSTLENIKIFADKKQIMRILNNLLNNAIQAIKSNIQGNIEVGISTREGKVLIYIKDNGEGIPNEMKDKIFISNLYTKPEGMGLGFAIVSS